MEKDMIKTIKEVIANIDKRLETETDILARCDLILLKSRLENI